MREDWQFVDESIPLIRNDPTYYKWAFFNLKDQNRNVRDLAVSIIEKSDVPEEAFAGMRDQLFSMMMGDNHIYVRYRAAFALAAHGPGSYKEQVVATLKSAAQDKDVGEIARGYLRQMSPPRIAAR